MNYSQQVKEIAAKVFDVDIDVITDDLATGELDRWDSVGNLAFLNALEEELEVDIPIEDLFDLTDIKTIIEEIEKLKNE